jgi:hypothetical protein
VEWQQLWHVPLLMSMTSIIMSMIWTPVMMVRRREAWPGQSTSVNCSCGAPRWASWGGVGTYGGADAEETGSAPGPLLPGSWGMQEVRQHCEWWCAAAAQLQRLHARGNLHGSS